MALKSRWWLGVTALKTLAVAVGALAVETVCVVLALALTLAPVELDFDAFHGAPYGLRVLAAVATAVVCVFTAGAAAFVSLRVGARWRGASPLGAVFTVAISNVVFLYFLLAYITFINACTYDVTFPLVWGGECNVR